MKDPGNIPFEKWLEANKNIIMLHKRPPGAYTGKELAEKIGLEDNGTRYRRFKELIKQGCLERVGKYYILKLGNYA